MAQMYRWPQSTESRLARIGLAPHRSFDRDQVPGAADREELDNCAMAGSLHVYVLCGWLQPTESRLARIRLAPHEVRKVRVRTIPLSGSNYPVQLTVKS